MDRERLVKTTLIIFLLSIFLGWGIGLFFELSTPLVILVMFFSLFTAWLVIAPHLHNLELQVDKRNRHARVQELEKWKEEHPTHPSSKETKRTEAALEQLKEKYRAGEIDEAQYRREYMFLIK